MADENTVEKEQSDWDKLLRQTWLSTSLERDKTVIALSSAGLGFIVTFITKEPTHHCMVQMLLLTGIIAFAAAILAGVRVLHINRAIIGRELKREPEIGGLLSDKILIGGFVIGVIAVSLIGLISIFSS